MKKLNYNQLNVDQKQEVDHLVADMEGKQTNSTSNVRFVARGGGEFFTLP